MTIESAKHISKSSRLISNALSYFLASAGDEELRFEAVPDFDVEDTSVRICRLRVFKIGDALPCLFHSNLRSKEVLSKSAETRPFNDFGEIDMGRACPARYPEGDITANQFTAQLVFELPPQATYSADGN